MPFDDVATSSGHTVSPPDRAARSRPAQRRPFDAPSPEPATPPFPFRMSSLPSLAELIESLRGLSPRALRFLGHRHLDVRSLGESAAHFGISEEALRIHLLRSARELRRRLQPAETEADTLQGAQEELEDADALERAVTAPAPGAAPASTPDRPEAKARQSEVEQLAALCRQLRELGPRLALGLEEAERAEFESPRGRRRERLRLVAIAALVLLTVWMSLR